MASRFDFYSLQGNEFLISTIISVVKILISRIRFLLIMAVFGQELHFHKRKMGNTLEYGSFVNQ